MLEYVFRRIETFSVYITNRYNLKCSNHVQKIKSKSSKQKLENSVNGKTT